MNDKFEVVSRFADAGLPIPERATDGSAGHDFVVAEDIVIPPYDFIVTKVREHMFEKNPNIDFYGFINPLTLDQVAEMTKELKAKITLVSTGMKCRLDKGEYLQLTARSSLPLKHWLIIGNGVGVIDQDYYNNPDNEGEIFFQVINLLPFAIQLKKGDKIGQGIISTYGVTENDEVFNKRTGGFGSTDCQ